MLVICGLGSCGGGTLDFIQLPDDILVVQGKVTDLAECIRRRVRSANLAVPAGGFDGNDRAYNDDPTHPSPSARHQNHNRGAVPRKDYLHRGGDNPLIPVVVRNM
jgi:hypothetical protein